MERKKAKNLTALERGSTRLARRITYVTGRVLCRHCFILEPVREEESIIIFIAAYRMGPLHLFLTLLYFTLLLPFTWTKLLL